MYIGTQKIIFLKVDILSENGLDPQQLTFLFVNPYKKCLGYVYYKRFCKYKDRDIRSSSDDYTDFYWLSFTLINTVMISLIISLMVSQIKFMLDPE